MPESSYIAVASEYAVSVTSGAAVTMSGAGFTLAQLDAAETCYITVETATVRFTYDGTAPTTSTGHPLAANASFTLVGNAQIRLLQFIAPSTSATINITIATRL
jgi:hypothetical protein